MGDAEVPAEAPGPEPEAAPKAVAPEPAEDWATRFKYLYADFENYRKRVERERELARRAARTQLLQSLLPIWEGFERAREAVRALPPKDPIRAGMELLRNEWERVFEAEGIEPVARVGEPFRATEHEAVGEVAATPRLGDGMISEVVQQGYRSSDGLLRTAKVVVARVPVAAPTPEAPAPGTTEGP